MPLRPKAANEEVFEAAASRYVAGYGRFVARLTTERLSGIENSTALESLAMVIETIEAYGWELTHMIEIAGDHKSIGYRVSVLATFKARRRITMNVQPPPQQRV